MSIEKKIDLYPALPLEERRDVEKYVEAHPHLRRDLDQAKELDRILREGHALYGSEPESEAVAFAAVMGDVDGPRMPAELAKALRRLRERIQSDPDLQERFEAYRERRRQLEAGSDMKSQLDRLLGDGPSVPAVAPTSARSSRSPGKARRRRLRRIGKIAGALTALYLILFAVGRVTRPESARLARFDAAELRLEGYEELRGPTSATGASDVTATYLDALEHLRRAEDTFVGLFPTFDSARLDAAAESLRDVLETEPEESFLSEEAAFLLAKTELARGNEEEARALFERVVTTGGRRSEEARHILAALAG